MGNVTHAEATPIDLLKKILLMVGCHLVAEGVKKANE